MNQQPNTPQVPDQPEDGFDPLLLLASSSVGRRETLRRAGIAHTVQAAHIDEAAVLRDAGDLAPEEAVLLLAREKASAVLHTSRGGYVVLGCDSMLELDGTLLGKPGDVSTARERWRAQRGRTATLHSGHWLIDDRDPDDGGTGATLGATASVDITFADLSDDEVEAYVSTGEPLGVAGSFTIDGIGGPYITEIAGDPHAVVGLSLPLLRDLLHQIALPIHALWRADTGSL